MDWKRNWEEITNRIREQHPELEVFGSRHKDANIEEHRREGYEIHHVTATEAKKLGYKDESGVDGSTVTCGDLIVMSRPKEKLKEELKEQRELNERKAKQVDQANREKLRRSGVRDM
jgi:prephenate dehydrogenase